MLSTPLPTPYDILPLPHFPMSVGVMAFVVLLIVALGIGWIATRPKRSPHPATLLYDISKECDSLKRRVEGRPSLSREDLERCSRLIRRYLACYVSPEMESSGKVELLRKSETLSREQRALLSLLIEIEEKSYAPEDRAHAPSTLLETLSRAVRDAQEELRRTDTPTSRGAHR